MSDDSVAAVPPLGTIEQLLAPTPYRAVRLLGRGGMGAVYLVEHEFLGARFALKVPHAELAADHQFVDRMRVEAQATARLDHPNIVQVVDYWTAADGRPCLVMEFLRGHTLRNELAIRGRLERAEALGLSLQALAALAAAHDAGIVHRDIKPENLFLQEVPGRARVLKILDFGVARVLPDAAAIAPAPLRLATVTGTRVGSPRYMSPEAVRGEKVDRRSDVFSMGIVLYVMLAGHGPLSADDAPSRYAPDIGPELDAVILRALGPSREERFGSAGEFHAALRDVSNVSQRGAFSPSSIDAVRRAR